MIENEKLIYQGRVIRLNIERVRLPNQHVAELEIIHHPGGAAIVAVDEQNRVCLLNQYRHAAGGYIWELPAGKIDNKEPHFETVKRELVEEAGRTATHWHYLGHVFSSPGVFTEVIHLYLATGLSVVNSQPEAHEVFHVEWKPVSEALQMIYRGDLCDSKSIVGLMLAAPHLGIYR